ncbi:MAG TPA: ROK family protein, partial [Tepidisphaeraceae bacterium]|nr:ROK family protein [Tepidisphaeraceae bacterium]
MSNSPGYTIGIDIGGTNVKAAAVSHAGTVLQRDAMPTGDADNAWRSTIRDLVARFEHALGRAESISVCCPGIVAPD